MKKEEIDISIVIPAYNEEKFIGNCLKSILNQKTNLIYEIIVVDNNSEDGTVKVVEGFKEQEEEEKEKEKKKIILLKEKRQGVGYARKTGTENSKGKIVVHIDADTVVTQDYFEKIMRIFSENSDVVCIGGQFKYYDGIKLKEFLRKILYKPTYFFAKTFSKGSLGPTGGNMAFKKNIYNKTSGFNPSFNFGEDGDLTIKLSKFGKIVVDFDLVCFVSVRRFNFDFDFLKYVFNFFWLCFFSRPFFNFLPDFEKK